MEPRVVSRKSSVVVKQTFASQQSFQPVRCRSFSPGVSCYRVVKRMSSCQGLVPQGARVLVTDLGVTGHINPTPASKPRDDPGAAAEPPHLCPEKLKSLCGTGDLSRVTSLEICVDTQENTLGNFGDFLPRLVQLRMSNSMIMSVRDLGTTLSHLQVLWMPRCSLQDLDGISTFSSLKELYVAYNSVSDLSQVGMLENLQLLDLEGNEVDDLVQVQFLGLCGKLQTLTLEGNPVCARPNPAVIQAADYSYRAAVSELVPQLRYLDNLRVDEDGFGCGATVGEDMDILRTCIRDCTSVEPADGARPSGRPASARRPASSRSCIWPPSSAGSRPHTGSRPASAAVLGVLSQSGSRPGSAESDLAAVEAETSILTHGAGKILFCGNPVKGIRARREKLRTAPTRSTFAPRDLPVHVPEHTYDLEEPDGRERADVFAELKAWREQHSSRLRAIETERLPQVLTITHCDEEEGEEDEEEEEEGFVCDGTDGSDEEPGEEKRVDWLETASLDSSFQSLSPDLRHSEASSPDGARLRLSPDPTPSPSPPPRAAAASHKRTPPGIICARKFRSCQTNSQRWNGTDGSRFSLPPHTPCPPPAHSLGKRLMDSCVRTDVSAAQSANKHLQTDQMSRVLDRPAITRPHTARAALQKHRPHHTLQPCRGSSQPL